MWPRCHIPLRAAPSPVTHFLLIHTRGDTHTAPGMPYPLTGRKRRCGSRLILYGPGARREARAQSSAARHPAFVTPVNSGGEGGGVSFQDGHAFVYCFYGFQGIFFFSISRIISKSVKR